MNGETTDCLVHDLGKQFYYMKKNKYETDTYLSPEQQQQTSNG